MPNERSDGFATTHWSVIAAAAMRGSDDAARALSTFCRTYWAPVHAYVLRRIGDPERARDLTQEFFARLLEGNGVAGADAARGRFRAYLLGAVRHFLADQRDRERALKRGGGKSPLSLDHADDASRRPLEPADDRTPERLFEREWALALLERVLTRLREEYETAGALDEFQRLESFLTDVQERRTYAEVAREAGLAEGTLRMRAQRLRDRYRVLLRAEVAETVDHDGIVDDELRDLFDVLRAS